MAIVIYIDRDLCTGCRRCAEICPAGAIEGNQGEPQIVNSELCVNCGQCVQICSAYASPYTTSPETMAAKNRERHLLPAAAPEPLFAAHNESHEELVKEALSRPDLFNAVQFAPAIRFALAEDFGLSPQVVTVGRIVAALRRLGFKYVYDTNFAADLTVMEEGYELLQRLQGDGALPLFSSCCPAWVKFVEQAYPQLIANLSTCKSPQQMAGAIFKTYTCQLDPDLRSRHLFVTAVMPCIAKKFECNRPELGGSYGRDVDAVLTTRELAHLIKDKGIDWHSLAEEEPDQPLGKYSGAGAIFGVTGGVTEAVLRTAAEVVGGKPLEEIEFHEVRGMAGTRRVNINLGKEQLEIIIVAGLKNVVPILDDLIAGKASFHFMEVMACPAGCLSGGGQPKILVETYRGSIYRQRAASIYNHDRDLPVRKAHENPSIKQLYADFLGQPLSELSHSLLHTHYTVRRSDDSV
ncbi:[Fe-Fe] hydrogenase large subunit C-terminal domain-containing protein [Moorella sp. Hama-1]|uniref:[Fe-Fe] hydrogenase large subunit C-terminal domain-containing protein n=1 Tax=Moorella sp. Hama-1 TaxID=2138101 RepID=UPI00137B00E0|nr:[Fe-Fe] hydrogenase large subunit C-terminal domain-containing protein [Moorella sp. Hama-1]